MRKFRRGNYLFVAWIGDHHPQHVHVFRDGKLIVKWNLDKWTPMKGKASSHILDLLRQLRKEGAL